MSRADKKAKFTEQKSRKASTMFLIGVGVIIVAAVGFFALRKPQGIEGTVNVGATDYTNQSIEMTEIKPEITDTKVVVNMDDIKNNKIVTFNVPGISFTLNNGTPFNYLPLVAYVSPQGNVVLARSLCEPCSGTRFHIEGEELVCNACGTRWSLENLQGISGGCPEYPPETVKYQADGNKMVIDMQVLKNWQPRPI
ncbi:hypothetical protein Tfer_0684 [Thermincola ferriacetica]|uniref:Membrane iron-sulfur containing protein FtrD-like domain-containing protein n=1 Tax=Thermincola ferriacetica TaxID=281456 RepID=A0A0L6W4K5_9FIRM|nr:Fe-S-containing protein [Thermincola ferriacetica]KNZ70502.1 hypothetical protein Tfer_0684 [Thermincola ferriacetica]